MQIQHGSRWFFRETLPHVVTYWPELLPSLALLSSHIAFSEITAAGKESVGSLTPSIRCFSLAVTYITSIHNQWVTRTGIWLWVSQRRIFLLVPEEEYHWAWVSIWSLTHSDLSSYTWNVLSTGSQCSIDRAKGGDEAKAISKEEEEKEKEGRSMEEMHRKKLDSKQEGQWCAWTCLLIRVNC